MQSLNGSKKASKANAIENMESRMKSFKALELYAENTTSCRHEIIAQFFADQGTPLCDWACDWHKDPQKLKNDKSNTLDDEEWCQTQRERGAYDDMNLD